MSDVPPNDGCGGRIDFELDLETLKESITRESLNKRTPGQWKYFELMPINDRKNIVTAGEGGTPLIESKRLGKEWGMDNLSFKIETVNPSGSFKDRPICVGVSKALEDGVRTVSAASSGNAAASMSTFAARGGLQAVVFVPEDAPKGKLIHLRTLGAKEPVRISSGISAAGSSVTWVNRNVYPETVSSVTAFHATDRSLESR